MKHIILFILALLLLPSIASAQPQVWTCSNVSPCVSTYETLYAGTAMTARSSSGRSIDAYDSGSGTGVYAASSSGDGLSAYSSTGTAVYAATPGGGTAVWGHSTSSILFASGVRGDALSQDGAGVEGIATGQYGTGVYAEGDGTNGYGIYAACYGGAGCYAGYFEGNVTYTGSLTHVSDERLKKDIAGLEDPLGKLLMLRGVTYRWKDPTSHGGAADIQRGFIAQEYAKVFPDAVRTNADGMMSIDTTGLDAMEVESIRALEARIKVLEARPTGTSTQVVLGTVMIFGLLVLFTLRLLKAGV